MYQYLLMLILLACICPTTLATDSLGRTQNPAPIHHKKLLKHRAPPLDSGFDYGTLRPCNDASDCHVWQVCASCTKKTFGSVVKYCSDASERGLCGLVDETMSCTCKDPNLAEIASLGRAGLCQTDHDCEDLLSPQFGAGTGFRCATCVKSFTPGIEMKWGNVCTRPKDVNPSNGQAVFYCDPMWLDTCSCGQVRPRPALPGGSIQGTLFELPPPSHVMGEGGANSNENNLFALGSDGSPAPSLEGEGEVKGGGGVEGMLLQAGEKNVAGFVPMGNVGDGEVPVQADLWG